MNLLLVSDLHYNLPQFDWLMSQAESCDLLVIAGDLLDIAAVLEPDAQIVVVSKYLEKLSQCTHVAVCSGNHDGDERDEHGEFVAQWLREIRGPRLSVDGDRLMVDGTLFSICPWWDGDHARGEVEKLLVSHSSLECDRWVWLNHCPPDQLPVCWTGRQYAGDDLILDLIGRLRPDMVFSGHIHNAPFHHPKGSWQAKCGEAYAFNPGKQIGAVPAFVRFNLETSMARYSNMEGEETLAMESVV